ncbi:MAG: hypothetical protein PVF37_20425 [Desulfobacterales bacterium]|jgi:predicted DNA binding CopG/RHH family protein
MIIWDDTKNIKLKLERQISFEQISEIILRKGYLDILENPSRTDQQIFVIYLNNYVYAVPFLIDENSNIILKTAYPSRKLSKKTQGETMNSKLDKFEQAIEENIESWTTVSKNKRASIENIIQKANKKKNISLRLKTHDIEQLKLRADSEGLPYQTLLSSIVHKFVTDQLVDKKNILKSIELLKAQNIPL